MFFHLWFLGLLVRPRLEPAVEVVEVVDVLAGLEPAEVVEVVELEVVYVVELDSPFQRCSRRQFHRQVVAHRHRLLVPKQGAGSLVQ